MAHVSFIVPGAPIGKGRPRFTLRGRCYTPSETRAYENLIKISFITHVPKPWKLLEGPLHVTLFALYNPPQSRKLHGNESRYRTVKPDLDNLIKCLDALNNIAWHDDSQVASILAAKYETHCEPCLKIMISWGDSIVPLPPHD